MSLITIISIFEAFSAMLLTEAVYQRARLHTGDFTRNRGKMPLPKLILYTIFRNCKDTSSELSKFYSSIGESNNKPSRQAAFKRLKCLNSQVWPYLSEKFTELFYASGESRTINNYLVWASDTSSFEMPYSHDAAKKFGIHKSNHVKTESDAGKVLVRGGGLYDVVNHIFVDYVLKPFKESERSILKDQLKQFSCLLSSLAIIILADRGYISLELMVYAQMLGYKFCFRATRSTYRSIVGRMSSDDAWVEISLRKNILSRISDAEVLSYLEGKRSYRVRVVKRYWTDPDTGVVSMIVYFTNLSQNQFTADDIMKLYEKRWKIELAYRTLKTTLELERHVSLDPEVALNILYGKIAFYNFTALFRGQLESLLSDEDQRLNQSNPQKGKKNKYTYEINAKALINELYSENLVKCLIYGNDIATLVAAISTNLTSNINQYKTSIRLGRHFKRWGKPVTCSYKYKFLIDGRNHPKIALVGGVLRTVKP